jgi:hypothetical protein
MENKVKLQILRQFNDHEGSCYEAVNKYFEEMMYYTTNVPEEYKEQEKGYIIVGYNWEKHVEELIPPLHKGDTRKCFVGSAGKYDLDIHDYKLTILNAVIV